MTATAVDLICIDVNSCKPFAPVIINFCFCRTKMQLRKKLEKLILKRF